MSATPGRVLGAVVAAGVLAVGLTSANAVADPVETTAAGAIGMVDTMIDGEPVRQAPIAPCDVDGEQNNDSGRVTVGDVAKFWGGDTACTHAGNGHAHAKIAGRYFATDVLREWGGPRIKVSSFKLSCKTVQNGASGRVDLRGVRGIDLPEDIPSNYTVMVPGRIEGAAPLAKVIVNELQTPSPADGSMTMHAMRIVLFPEGGGPNSGDITLGTVSCDPYGG